MAWPLLINNSTYNLKRSQIIFVLFSHCILNFLFQAENVSDKIKIKIKTWDVSCIYRKKNNAERTTLLRFIHWVMTVTRLRSQILIILPSLFRLNRLGNRILKSLKKRQNCELVCQERKKKSILNHQTNNLIIVSNIFCHFVSFPETHEIVKIPISYETTMHQTFKP